MITKLILHHSQYLRINKPTRSISKSNQFLSQLFYILPHRVWHFEILIDKKINDNDGLCEGYKQKNSEANLVMMFDAHAKRIDEYSNKNRFLAVRTMNEAPYCGTIPY